MGSLYIWFDSRSLNALRRALTLSMSKRTLLYTRVRERSFGRISSDLQTANICETLRRYSDSENIEKQRFLRQWKLRGRRGKAKNLLSTLGTLQLCDSDWYLRSSPHE